ncbi:hypothetical protein GOP47_0025381 [Adiantum capillus-veneris]|uniref:Uncharacterized protein n=1 Tax=Adiantum capillus-veneris TaxID=13818 RepID=A0A9D4Z3J0_ADICA|nr:hypothetical protein GOP47_0025381 [Adiantum capillus-veneris]
MARSKSEVDRKSWSLGIEEGCRRSRRRCKECEGQRISKWIVNGEYIKLQYLKDVKLGHPILVPPTPSYLSPIYTHDNSSPFSFSHCVLTPIFNPFVQNDRFLISDGHKGMCFALGLKGRCAQQLCLTAH